MAMFWRAGIAPDIEPNAVKMTRGQMVDSIRGDRVINLKAYSPGNTSLTGLPLIVWSHGLGGSIDGAAFISRYMAANNYIVLHVQHHGTDSGLWEGKPGHPWDVIRATHIPRSATIARFVDIPFVLDNLPEWLEQNPHLKPMVDLNNVAMSGHSLGSLTTQVMMGQRFPDGDGLLQDYADPRFKCGMLYSPIPEFRMTGHLPIDIYSTIDRPLFHMTGTDDSSPVEGFEYEKRLEVYADTGCREKYMFILKDGDHMIYNGSRGKLGQNPNREKHERLIKMASLAYWDAKLKGDVAADEWLTGGGFATYLNGDGEFKFER